MSTRDSVTSRLGASGNVTRRDQRQISRDPGDTYVAATISFAMASRADSVAITARGWGYAPGDTASVDQVGAVVGAVEVDTVMTPLNITAASTSPKRFTVAGNHAASFMAGATVTVAGSTGNDGDYTVVSGTYVDPDTLIVVLEAVPDTTADGTIESGAVTGLLIDDAGGNYVVAAGIPTTTLTGAGTGLTVEVATLTDATAQILDSASGFAFSAGDLIEVRGSVLHSRTWRVDSALTDKIQVASVQFRAEAAGPTITVRHV